MAMAVLRSSDGRVRPIWRFLIAATLAFVCWIGVGVLLRPATIVSPVAVLAFVLIVVINVSIFFALSLALDRASRPMAYIGFTLDVPVARLIVVGFVFGAAMVSLAVSLSISLWEIFLSTRALKIALADMERAEPRG